MTGVKINPHQFTDGIAQFEQCLGVIHQLMGMLLNANLFDAVRAGTGVNLVEPGDMTKFMSVPWHTDYNSCATHPTSPTIPHNTTLYWSWPAQRPCSRMPISCGSRHFPSGSQ